MHNLPARPVQKVLAEECADLRRLVQRARRLHALTIALRGLLPATLRDHCAVGAFHDRTLVVCADSAAWASKLRFHAPTLVTQLRELPELRDIAQVRIKVAPPRPPGGMTSRERRPMMSVAGANIIEGCAQAVDDVALKEALQRLASRGKRPAGPPRSRSE